MQVREIPQSRVVAAMNFPKGNLTRKYAIAGCATSCATYTIAPSLKSVSVVHVPDIEANYHEYCWPTRFVSSTNPKTEA